MTRTPVALLRWSASVLLLIAAGCTPPGSSKDGGTRPGVSEGEACGQDSECLSGHCPALPSEPQVCRDECSVDGTCAANKACTRVDSARLCLPLVSSLPGGDPCETSRQCASGQCVSLAGPAEPGTCVEACPANEQCGSSRVCAVLNGVSGQPYCVTPEARRPNGAECTSGRQCAGGRCLYWGGRAQCASSCLGGCADAGACVQQGLNGSGCMQPGTAGSVCGANDECEEGACFQVTDGGMCVGACGTDRECPGGYGCVSLVGSSLNRACAPLVEERPAGQACSTELQCQSGRCARFASPSGDAGTLCADPCDGGACAAPLVCWGRVPDAGQRGLCGPQP